MLGLRRGEERAREKESERASERERVPDFLRGWEGGQVCVKSLGETVGETADRDLSQPRDPRLSVSALL